LIAVVDVAANTALCELIKYLSQFLFFIPSIYLVNKNLKRRIIYITKNYILPLLRDLVAVNTRKEHNFVEEFKNLARYRSENIFIIDH